MSPSFFSSSFLASFFSGLVVGSRAMMPCVHRRSSRSKWLPTMVTPRLLLNIYNDIISSSKTLENYYIYYNYFFWQHACCIQLLKQILPSQRFVCLSFSRTPEARFNGNLYSSTTQRKLNNSPDVENQRERERGHYKTGVDKKPEALLQSQWWATSCYSCSKL